MTIGHYTTATRLGEGLRKIHDQKDWSAKIADNKYKATVFDKLYQLFKDLFDGQAVYELDEYRGGFSEAVKNNGKEFTLLIENVQFTIIEVADCVVISDSQKNRFEIRGASFQLLNQAMEDNHKKIEKLKWGELICLPFGRPRSFTQSPIFQE